MKKNILVVFGTRPELIKLAPVIKKLAVFEDINLITCSTGQHVELLDTAQSIFGIEPTVNLKLMKEKQSLSDLTANILISMRQVFSDYNPHLTIVHGDTATSMACALSSFYHSVPVAHVEAGLRSGNKVDPWPEELNRSIISQIASLHLCPTEVNEINLKNENISKGVFVTGNTVIDALNTVLRDERRNPNCFRTIDGNRFQVNQQSKNILVTTHRRENVGERLNNICNAVYELALEQSEIEFIIPVHPNPSIRNQIIKNLGNLNKIHLLDPLNYVEFVSLMSNCYLVITDSGGLQEEAPSLNKPVLLVRETTERPEGVSAGNVLMVGTSKAKIKNNVVKLIECEDKYRSIAELTNPFGDGKSSDRIVDIVRDYLF
jgi:UDP-N-acetylglucosamine 2-epimerase (non-hydrolysing)